MRFVTHLFASVVSLGITTIALADASFTTTLDTDNAVAVEVSPTEADTWNQFVEITSVVPYGTSYSPLYDFGRGVDIEALRVRLYQYVGEICGASLYAIDVALTPYQRVLTRYFPDQNGEIRLPNSRLYKAAFVLSQARVRGGRCVARMDGLISDPNDPDLPSDYTLAGVIPYVGGFRHQEILSVSGADKVSSFMVRVPTFCSDVEVLEGGTITEGVYEAARLVDAERQIFSVNNGVGSRISGIALSLNGPRDLTCDLPVYVKTVQ